MGKKVFLSFLGAGTYQECIYNEGDNSSSEVKFIQNAIIQLEEKNNKKFDEKIIFCTDASIKGFDELCNEKGYNYKQVKIPDGKNEQEIWEVFDIVYKELEENDEIIFDITHSFRYLPMLGITLLQYAKFLKNINVNKICYGLFDPVEYKNKKEENKECKVEFPIIDITSFSTLQDWSLAGHLFLKSGIVEDFANISKAEFKPQSRDFDKDKNELYKISGYLKNLSNDIHTNRGINIVESKQINQLRQGINEIENKLYPPFQYALKKIEDEVSKFEEKETLNFISSVEWCIKRNLIQQGITMLQEGLITHLLNLSSEEYKDKNLRMEFSNYFGKEDYTEKDDENLRYNSEKMKTIKQKIVENGIDFEKLKENYCKLKNIRNDINHGGFNLDSNKWNKKSIESEIKSESLKENLEESLIEIKKIILQNK